MELKPGTEPPVRPPWWRRALSVLFALLQTRANGHAGKTQPRPQAQRGDAEE